MPWNEISVMDQRTRFVAAWLSGEYSVSGLCRSYGISRKTAYKWIDRYMQAGPGGLDEQSRAPHHCPQRVVDKVRERIVEAKLAHQHWGPKKVMDWLRRTEPDQRWCADSTAGEILKEAGLVRGRKRRWRVPADPAPFRDCNRPNRVWSVDYKGQFRLGDGHLCYPLTVTDNYSRYLLQCQALAHPRYPETRQWLEWTFRNYGLPEAIRSDNGTPFASTAVGGLSRLSKWWIQLSIRPERIEPGNPQQNGRHERFHGTLKEAVVQPPAHSLQAQQKRFEAFQKEYNQERSHESLARKCPAQVYEASPRPYPERIPEIEYPEGMTVRQVRHNGEIKWKGSLIYLSEILAQERVGLNESEDGIVEIRYSFHLLAHWHERTLKLVPAKDWHSS